MIGTWLKRVVLWFGLLLCIYALWHARALAGDAIGRVSMVVWTFIGSLLVSSWLLAAMTWRQYLLAYTGHEPSMYLAMRQLGLLLVGKYVPGGVFGFLARLYDQPSVPRERLFWAGLAEQAVGIAVPIALGGVLYLSAQQKHMGWLGLALLLPPVAVAGVWALHHMAGMMPWLRRYAGNSLEPSWRELLTATVLQLTQQIVWVVVIVVLVRALFGLQPYAALGVAGAFWLAVAAGMLVIFSPGGIGVREVALVGMASPWLGTTQAIFLSALLRIVSSLLDVSAGGVAALLGRQSRDKGSGI